MFNTLKIELLDENAMPYKKHKSDAGLDLRNASGSIEAKSGESFIINTGVKIAIPKGFFGLVVPRSSKGIQGLELDNTVGIIDSDYRGEIRLFCTNVSSNTLLIEEYERVAQLVIIPCFLPKIKVVKSLSKTKRGSGGFGSTGEK